jgi:hypothetical protein
MTDNVFRSSLTVTPIPRPTAGRAIESELARMHIKGFLRKEAIVSSSIIETCSDV